MRTGVLRASIAALAALSLLGLVAPLVPLLDAFNHIRVFVLLASAIAFALTWRAWPNARCYFAGLTALNALLVAIPTYVPASAYAAAEAGGRRGQHVKIISFNVWIGNTDIEPTLKFVLQENADIVLLLELRNALSETLLDQLKSQYPHQVVCLGKGCGMALLSRLPFERSGSTRRGIGPPNVWASFGPLHRWRILGTHLQRPDKADVQVQELSELSLGIAQDGTPPAPTIVAGDFNLTPWSWTFATFIIRNSLVRHGMLLPSWPSHSWLPPLFPIDHILSTPDIKTVSIETGPHLGSDHRPIIARLRIPGP